MARASKDKDTTATERLAEALAEQKRLTAGWKACEAARSAFEQRAAKAQARFLGTTGSFGPGTTVKIA